MATHPKMLWYSVITSDGRLIEYEMPDDPLWRTREQLLQWEELTQLAAANNCTVRSMLHKTI